MTEILRHCSQCGGAFVGPHACGPTHAIIAAGVEALARAASQAMNDPGSVVRRGPGYDGERYGEPLSNWQKRALTAAISDWLAVHDDQVRRDATREALLSAADDIKARIVTFRELNADHQYMNALNDAWGLVANRLRADTAPEPAARAVPTEGEAWECGPHTNAWNGHDARCRRVPAPTPPTVGDDEAETLADTMIASDILMPDVRAEAMTRGHVQREPFLCFAHAVLDAGYRLASRTPSPSVDGAALAESIKALADDFKKKSDEADVRASRGDTYADVRRLTWEAAERRLRAALAQAAETRGEGPE